MTESTLPHRHLGAGAPLVVFPGLTGRHGVPVRLGRLMQHLEIVGLSGDRSVWSIDRRYGLEHDVTMGDLAEDYAGVLTDLFEAPVDIVGISTGGTIALQLAADHPELVRRLVLVSAAHRLSDFGRGTQREIASLLRDDRPRRAASLFLSNTGATAMSRAVLRVAGVIAPRLVVGRKDPDLLVTLDAEDSFDLESRLHEITVPVLITGGGHDRFYTAEMFRATHAALPNSSLEIYPHGGHIGTLGNRRLTRQILRFLDATD